MPLIDDIRAWLLRREGIVGTHYEECWMHHPACVATILLEALDHTAAEPPPS